MERERQEKVGNVRFAWVRFPGAHKRHEIVMAGGIGNWRWLVRNRCYVVRSTDGRLGREKIASEGKSVESESYWKKA